MSKEATGTAPQSGEAKLSQLIAHWEEIGPQARRLLVALGGRLALGARLHGDFDTARDWTREASEEALDGCVYLAARLVRP